MPYNGSDPWLNMAGVAKRPKKSMLAEARMRKRDSDQARDRIKAILDWLLLVGESSKEINGCKRDADRAILGVGPVSNIFLVGLLCVALLCLLEAWLCFSF